MKRRIREILETGAVTYRLHARQRMQERQMDDLDVHAVLRSGIVEPAELERGEWRYRVRSADRYVVVAFPAGGRLAVVTVWR